MNRITKAQLQNLVDQLNDLQGTAREPWFVGAAGRLSANVDSLFLNHNELGWQLQAMCAGGGSRTVSGGGRVTMRELYDQLRAIRAYVEKFDNN